MTEFQIEFKLIRHDRHKNFIGEVRTWKIMDFLSAFKLIEVERVKTIMTQYDKKM